MLRTFVERFRTRSGSLLCALAALGISSIGVASEPAFVVPGLRTAAPAIAQASFTNWQPVGSIPGESRSLRMYNDLLVIGRGGFDGSVSVFRRINGVWVLEQDLAADPQDPAGDALNLGISSAVQDNTIVLGSERSVNPEVYIFQKVGAQWVRQAILREPTGNPVINTGFGKKVELLGRHLFVSAPNYGNDTGVVYVFERDGSGAWLYKQRIFAPQPNSGEFFGTAISASQGLLAISRPGVISSPGAGTYGQCILYSKETGSWSYKTTFVPQYDGAPGYTDKFGYEVKLLNNMLVVSAPYWASRRGFLTYYPFHWGGNGFVLRGPGANENADFGTSMDFNGENLIAGAPLTFNGKGGIAIFGLKSADFYSQREYVDPIPSVGSPQFGMRTALFNNIAAVSTVPINDPGLPPATYLYRRADVIDDAIITAVSAPSEMYAGAEANVSVTVKNTGSLSWAAVSNRLCAVDPLSNSTWGRAHAAIPAGVTIFPGETYTFNFKIKAPATKGEYSFVWQMLRNGNPSLTFGHYSEYRTIRVIEGDASTFTSQYVPSLVEPDRKVDVQVVMRNVGSTTWTRATHRLVSLSSPSTIWGANSALLSETDAILPGQYKTFNFRISPPLTPGTYAFQWQMRRLGVANFGPATPLVNVVVRAVNRAQFRWQTVPSSMTAGANYTVTVAMKNTGSEAWTSSGYVLYAANPVGTNRWGTVSAPVTSTVPVGSSHSFTFNVKAPSTPGTYNFQWQMRKSGLGQFGDASVNLPITVN